MYNAKIISESVLHIGISFNGNVYYDVTSLWLAKKHIATGFGPRVVLEWSLKLSKYYLT